MVWSGTRDAIAHGALDSALSSTISNSEVAGTAAGAGTDTDIDTNVDAADAVVHPQPAAATSPVCRPEFESSWLSRTLFLWFNPLIAHGKKQPLTEHDIPPFAPPEQCTAAIAREVAANWRAEQRRPMPFLCLRSRTPSLFRACYRTVWRTHLFAGFLRFVAEITAFVGPLITNLILRMK